MGKTSDKLYITHSEWEAGPGGARRAASAAAGFRRLPFHCCALTLQPFETPVCTAPPSFSGSHDVAVYELTAIIPWLKAHKSRDPVSGARIANPSTDLIHLNFARNATTGDFHCPITFKVFTESTHIVAISTSGNVYAFEAVEQLNIKPKNWKDLVSGEPFTRKDILSIQNPNNVADRNIAEFDHVKKNLAPPPSSASKADSDGAANVNAVGTTSRVLAELAAKKKAASSDARNSSTTTTQTPSFVDQKKKAYNIAGFSKGLASASFTSSAMEPVLNNESAVFNDHEYAIQHVRAKAATAIIQTNLGNLTLKLFISHAPRTCYNFITLARRGYYKGTLFHRLIPKFMVQGGDPTGTGTGGESVWGQTFEDEFRSGLSHAERGILSMANRGPNTNTSQFFITFVAKPHLDGKHTIFGKLVDGMTVLDRIEKLPTDADTDRPERDLQIIDIVVEKDPFEEALAGVVGKDERAAEDAARRAAERARKERLIAATKTVALPTDAIGKYLDKALEKRKRDPSAKPSAPSSFDDVFASVESGKKKKTRGSGNGFGNFDGW